MAVYGIFDCLHLLGDSTPVLVRPGGRAASNKVIVDWW